MFVVFEGIDGSGKTTVSNLVATRLREHGIPVEHVREGGQYGSPLVNRLREFGKDNRNLAMAPVTELLLYTAREAQLLAECVLPALERGSLVISDRYLYSYEVLGHHGRGLPIEQVRAVLDAVSDGVWPDLVVLMDVDPHVAEARRKVSKLAKKRMSTASETEEANVGGSRKGLHGTGTLHRLREGYLALARQDRERWLIMDNSGTDETDKSLEDIVSTLSDAIAKVWQRRSRTSIRILNTAEEDAPAGELVSVTDFDAGRDAFYRAVRARALREVPVAAYFLAQLEDERAYDLRDEWAERAPDAVAYGLHGLGGERAWALRERLTTAAPYHVVRSLEGPAIEGERAQLMRERFLDTQPAAVLATLDGNDSEHAWSIRERLAESHLGRVVASLANIDTDRAWALRQYYETTLGAGETANTKGVSYLVESLRGLGNERAWVLRERYLDVLPVAVLGSLVTLTDDRSWVLRERFVGQAPKVVLRTFDGSRDPRAWSLRARYAPRVKESLGSMIGLDDDEAWGIREGCRELWPSTTIKSLGPLGLSGRGRDMALEALERHPGNISLLKHITRLAAMAHQRGVARESE